MREREMTSHLNSRSRNQGHINTAHHVARATELGTVATNSCGF